MVANKIAVVEVRINERDGILHAFSDDMPELHLCSDSRSKLFLDIPCMIKALYRLNYNLDVQVVNEAKKDRQESCGQHHKGALLSDAGA
jgi:hypothetical protein